MQDQLPQPSAVLRTDTAGIFDFNDGEQHSRRNPVRWLVTCGIPLIAAIALGTAMMIDNFRQHALESSKRELENTVLLMAHHFDQQLDDAAVPLGDIIAQVRQDGIATPEDFTRRMSAPETHLMLQTRAGDSSKVAGFNVYDARGVLISSSEVPGRSGCEPSPTGRISGFSNQARMRRRSRWNWCTAVLPEFGKP